MRAGLGIAVLSERAVAADVARGDLCVLRIEDLPLMRTFFLVTPTKREASPVAKAFAEQLRRDARCVEERDPEEAPRTR